MIISERIQDLVHKTETGIGPRILWTLVVLLILGGMTAWYDGWAYRGFSAPDAMDAAQVARNLADGHGYTTQIIQPFSLSLLQQKRHLESLAQLNLTNTGGFYPDLANAPVYPVMLAGLMKLHAPTWDLQLQKKFWSSQGLFMRYQPEFMIALFNQFLLLAVVVLTYFIGRKLFDGPVAWLAAVFTLGSSVLWKFSVSGLSTMFLLVIFLGLTLCLIHIESLARAEQPDQRRLFGFTMAAGVLAGVGLLTRYSFGWLIVPVVVFLALFGGIRRSGLAVTACLMFGLVAAPWLARNYAVSGNFFGTAGYALLEGTGYMPNLTLLQSTDPELSGARMHGGWSALILEKLTANLFDIFQRDLPRVGGWGAILFFAGLLLGFRNPAPGRLRYFTLICLGMLLLAQAAGRTWLSDYSPEFNSENLLVLLTPLVLIFGTAFFLTLLDQMTLPAFELRYVAVFILAVVLCLPFLVSFLPPRPVPTAYPPYNPPDIQAVGSWMHPDELVMSDMPWAVAWYGRHACVSLSKDIGNDFAGINHNFQPVKAVYLTTLTLDDKFLSNVARSDADSWGHFVFRVAEKNEFPESFPLQTPKVLRSGLLFADTQRWPSAHSSAH